MEFLVQMEVGPIEGEPFVESQLRAREAERARELASAGVLERLWRIPGRRANWGIWHAKDADELQKVLTSLPLFPYLKIAIHPLECHPNDPRTTNREDRGYGIPGLTGTDHFGVTVPDVEEATRFFVELIGCTPFYPLGRIRSDDDWMKTHLNVHPRAEITKIRFLRCRNGINFELFEYKSPDQRRQMPKNSDIGGHHIGIYVEDFDKALAYLKSKSVTVLGEPSIRTTGPNAGRTWIYFLTPWGMQMEMVSYPHGMAYEKDFAGRMWHPSFPNK
jgi:muconolactone delta-isomerase